MIRQKVTRWTTNPLTNVFNRIIDIPQPVPKGPAFKMKIVEMYQCKSYYDGEKKSIVDCTCGKCAAYNDYTEFESKGRVITPAEAAMPF